jgi:4-diphosphocytidyl-2-C-methyl-D-erythritol kinase
MGIRGRLEMQLHKRIPMGAGLGGGSSDAAAILLALPVLAGGVLSLEQLWGIAQELGSDITFFLLGGTAAGIGRGTELFPLPDRPARPGILVAPGVHVSTAEAYRALSSRLTPESQQNTLFGFQSLVWGSGQGCAVNDFEAVAFHQHPGLAALKKKLMRLGADPAMMTGSGSALYGFFRTRAEAARALESFGKETAFAISLISRASYQSLWWRALKPHMSGKLWPPRSRYMR